MLQSECLTFHEGMLPETELLLLHAYKCCVGHLQLHCFDMFSCWYVSVLVSVLCLRVCVC